MAPSILDSAEARLVYDLISFSAARARADLADTQVDLEINVGKSADNTVVICLTPNMVHVGRGRARQVYASLAEFAAAHDVFSTGVKETAQQAELTARRAAQVAYLEAVVPEAVQIRRLSQQMYRIPRLSLRYKELRAQVSTLRAQARGSIQFHKHQFLLMWRNQRYLLTPYIADKYANYRQTTPDRCRSAA